MNRRNLLLTAAALGLSGVRVPTARAALKPIPPKLPAGPPVQRWLDIAERLKPALIETEQAPLRLVRPVAEPASLLRFRMEEIGGPEMLETRALATGEAVTVDFGGHRTGYLSFDLAAQGRAADSPVRLRLTFGEAPPDVAEPLYPFTGSLSEAWLQDEIINVDDLPRRVRLPRRYAFRYVKIEVLAAPSRSPVIFRNMRAHAVTSAPLPPAPLPAEASVLQRRIDEVAVATLRDCLQTTFEDGPRRDRRLWLGDLRLQALTNYDTFKANDVVKRCLYLFAALPRQDGLVTACVYEKPTPSYGGAAILDYAALFGATLDDYVAATGDLETGHDLFTVAKRQLELLGATVGAEGLFVDPGDIFLFIDWSETLDRTAAIQGVLIYAYRRVLRLAQRLDREGEVAGYRAQIDRMVAAARARFYDPKAKVFISGPSRQVSWASQAWLAIAEVPVTRAAGAKAILTAMAARDAVRPVTPYLYHHMVAAMIACGLKSQALALVEGYWGGMVQAGADTFWEIYDPRAPLASPYGDIHLNSYCHAWSCTPAYFFRSGGLI